MLEFPITLDTNDHKQANAGLSVNELISSCLEGPRVVLIFTA